MNISTMYPKPHPQTAGRVIDGEAVLILADSSEVNVLNQVGSRIFELSDGSRTVEQISETISDQYDISREQADIDVREFLLLLVNQSVIVLEETREDL
jgi:hypothetical protein